MTNGFDPADEVISETEAYDLAEKEEKKADLRENLKLTKEVLDEDMAQEQTDAQKQFAQGVFGETLKAKGLTGQDYAQATPEQKAAIDADFFGRMSQLAKAASKVGGSGPERDAQTGQFVPQKSKSDRQKMVEEHDVDGVLANALPDDDPIMKY